MTELFPERIALRFDAGTTAHDRGKTLVGGAPRRLLRLSDRGAELVQRWRSGSPVGRGRGERSLARRLCDAGLAHPAPPAPDPSVRVAVVVPVKDDDAAIAELVPRLVTDPRVAEVVVVDDGSTPPLQIPAAADAVTPVRVVRRATNGGPAAARNDGWAATTAALVAFVDADVLPSERWLDPVLAHFADPSVAAVAPRVGGAPIDRRTDRHRGVLARYDNGSSPLDMGPTPAAVSARGRIRYVPTAAIVVRRSALDAVGGFDPELRFGEDVDWCWRVTDAGWRVRYEPEAVVGHRPRPAMRAFLDQRRGYGTAAAALERRHPGRVRPLETNPWTMAIAAILVGPGSRRGRSILALVVGVASASPVGRRLRGRTDHPWRLAVTLVGDGHRQGLGWVLHAIRRTWLPPTILLAALGVRPARRAIAAAAAASAATWRPGVGVDPIRHAGLRMMDDAAYGVGVWQGAWHHRDPAVLLPRRADAADHPG